MSQEFDVIIVGGGPTGEHAAGRARKAGLSVALVETELVGGECSYWACMPSKTLLRPGQVLAEARAVPGAAGAVTGELDAAAALARRDWMTSSWSDDGQVAWLNAAGVALFRGHGRIAGERRVAVEASDGTAVELVASKAVIIAVGSSAAVPPIAGLADSSPWTNREATAAEEIPRRLLVLGGGVVGVELAQAFRRLGSAEVTVLEGGERIVATAEPFASELLETALRKEGIVVRTKARVVGAARDAASGDVTVKLESGEELRGDELLVATGRHPRTGDLGVEQVGLEPGKYVPTDSRMRAEGMAGSWLYAIGDANGKALLTHMGKYQARVAVDSILGIDIEDESDRSAVTGTIFTDPAIGSVGLTEAAARSAGHQVKTVGVDLSSVAAAAIWGEDCAGRCQIVVDEATELIIGATFVGPGMSDMLHAATIAVVGKVPISRLRHAVPSFPSLSEFWLELVEGFYAA